MTKPKQIPENLTLMPAPLLAYSDNGEDFERHVNLGKMQALSALNAVSMIELGRRLIWHKANLAHGEFQQDLTSLPIGYRTAARMMNAARKLQGKVQAPALLKLGIEKIYDLAEELEPDEIKLLVDGEAINAITLDDVDKMTVRQLREALRKERKPKKRLTDAEEELKELRAENAALKGHKLAPTVEQAKRQASRFFDRIDEACREMNRIAIPDAEDGDQKGAVLSIIASNLHAAETRLQHLEAALINPHISEA